MLIDTHTHLYSEEFDKDRHKVIQRALCKGVKAFFLPAIDSKSHEIMLDLEQQFPNNIFAMMGLHPCYVKPKTWEKELSIAEQYWEKRDFCAVGEIGLDLYWDKSTLDIQIAAFERQIDWALNKNRPVVIHTRESFKETFEILNHKKHLNLRGIFHCFSGNLEQAQQAIELGFMLGIGGVVTFKNGKIDQFIEKIPLEHLVLETDAPYLAPVPFRGKRNESSYLELITDKLANLYGTDTTHIARVTTENALKIFGKI